MVWSPDLAFRLSSTGPPIVCCHPSRRGRPPLSAPLDPATAWQAVRAELATAVDDDTFELWLAGLSPRSCEEGRLVVAAPDHLRNWIERRFGRVLERAAAAALGPRFAVALVPASDHGHDRRRTEPRDLAADPGVELNPKLTFDQFVIGDSNRLAHAAALAVAELPGQAYNPLFVYGPPGVGKTHLLHSIANYVRAYGGGMTVRLTSVERFTNDFVAALQRKDLERFKAAYRHNDVLLIDDVQFLQSKARTEEEFFHTFNALLDAGAQLVLTSDRLPRDLAALEDRLRERFEAGLVTDIRAPDRPTRLAVLRKRVHHDGIQLDDGVLEVIADRIPHNVRALEGALIRTVAYASLTGRPLGPALAEEVLDGLYPSEPSAPATPPPGGATITGIQAIVCERFGLSHDELVAGGRAARVVWPRHLAMYLARAYTDASLPAIAEAFGGRNHTTVLNAVRRAGERLEGDPEAREMVRVLTAALGRSGSRTR